MKINRIPPSEVRGSHPALIGLVPVCSDSISVMCRRTVVTSAVEAAVPVHNILALDRRSLDFAHIPVILNLFAYIHFCLKSRLASRLE